ncbi:MAG: carbohydrate porin [Phycisphaerales bacterium]|nr:carbohydrate porin [Phycisphaerales bacterium]
MATNNTANVLLLFITIMASQAHASDDDSWSLLSDHTPEGVEIAGEWIGEYTGVVSGGVRSNGGVRQLLTIDAAHDLEAIFGLERTQVFAQLLHAEPGDDGGSADAGDLQGLSNIEIDRSLTAIYELWIEHELEDANLRIKLGKVDANSEFDALDMLDGFSNSSAGFSPTIFALPTFPDPSFSVNLFWSPTDAVTLGYGLYDGALAADGVLTGSRGPSSFFDDDRSNDWFHIAQVDIDWDHHHGGGLALGGWHHTGTFVRFDGGTEDDASGLFATIHQTLWRDTDSERSVELGLQYGWSDPDISEVEHHIGLGCVMHAPFTSRENDEIGVYCTWSDLSDEPGAGFDENETAIDAYYAIALHQSATLRPEVQYIFNPSGDPMINDALVLGFRLELGF